MRASTEGDQKSVELVTSGWEPPHVAAMNQTWAFGESSECS